MTSQRIVAIDAELHMSMGIKNKEKVTNMKHVMKLKGLMNKTVRGMKCAITAVACVSSLSSAPWT